mgnify:CR=1 FL=1
MKLGSKTTWLAAITLLVGWGITGCEWESAGEDSYWSDRYNWVDFSGVYKNPNGGSVVTDFTFTTPGTGGTGLVVAIGPVTVATGNGGNSYSGTLLPNVVPGSVQITAGGVTFTDNGNGGLVPSSGLATMNGSISYNSGAWNIFLGGVTVPSGDPIRARYSVYQSSGTSGTTGGNPKKGTTKTIIYSLTVFQEGNQLRVVDSDGREYTGKMGSLRSASGELGVQPRLGDTVIAQYSVKGVSRAGLNVEMTGTFQGTILSDSDGGLYVMGQRRMEGQWIEKNGKVGDIVGQAANVSFTYTSSTTP